MSKTVKLSLIMQIFKTLFAVLKPAKAITVPDCNSSAGEGDGEGGTEVRECRSSEPAQERGEGRPRQQHHGADRGHAS